MWRGHRPTRPRPERLLSTYSVQGHSAFPIPVLSPQPRAPPRMERWPLGQVTSSGEDGSSHPARPRGHGPGPQPALSKRLLGSRGAAPGRSRGGRVASGEQVALPGHHLPVRSMRIAWGRVSAPAPGEGSSPSRTVPGSRETRRRQEGGAVLTARPPSSGGRRPPHRAASRPPPRSSTCTGDSQSDRPHPHAFELKIK